MSSELGARLRVELEQTERLDAQFVEYLRCRGINPAVNTDSAAGSMSYSDDLLSPELQVDWFICCNFVSFTLRPKSYTFCCLSIGSAEESLSRKLSNSYFVPAACYNSASCLRLESFLTWPDRASEFWRCLRPSRPQGQILYQAPYELAAGEESPPGDGYCSARTTLSNGPEILGGWFKHLKSIVIIAVFIYHTCW